MFFSFVDELRAAGIPASMKEHLTLLEALDADIIRTSPEDFYYLARATFVKDESLLDRLQERRSRKTKIAATVDPEYLHAPGSFSAEDDDYRWVSRDLLPPASDP